MIWICVAIGVFFIIILSFGFYFILKKIPKSITTITENRNNSITPSDLELAISRGMKTALQEMEYEKEMEREYIKKSKRKNSDLGVYSSIEKDRVVTSSGGNLIPFGLSDEEKDALEMFYQD